MSDRIVEAAPSAAPDMPHVLNSLLFFLLKESREMLESGKGVTPRTALVLGDTLVEEEADGSTVETCYAKAAHTVRGAAGARGYGFVYDGMIETDNGTIDAIIAEGGVPSGEQGYAVGLVYTQAEDGVYTFEDEPIYIGKAPNFMSKLRKHAIQTPEDTQAAVADENEAAEEVEIAEETVEETISSEGE